MSFTNQYELKESTITSVVSAISEESEDFFDYLVRSITGEKETDLFLERAEDNEIFEALIDVTESKPFDRFIKVRQAGESNKELNKRYVGYLIERMKMSQLYKAVNIL